MINHNEIEKQMKNGITSTELSGFYKPLDKINDNCLKYLGKESQTLDDFGKHIKNIR